MHFLKKVSRYIHIFFRWIAYFFDSPLCQLNNKLLFLKIFGGVLQVVCPTDTLRCALSSMNLSGCVLLLLLSDIFYIFICVELFSYKIVCIDYINHISDSEYCVVVNVPLIQLLIPSFAEFGGS